MKPYNIWLGRGPLPQTKETAKLMINTKAYNAEDIGEHVYILYYFIWSIQDSNSSAQDGSCESPDGPHSSAFQHPRVSHSNNDSTDAMLGVSGISGGNIDLFSPIINEVDSQEDHFVLPQVMFVN
mgnify:FL=1